jgi:3-methylcrotonyl-CoA carboxylase beta subunit
MGELNMAKIASKIDVRSPEFAANSAAMQSLVADLRAVLAKNALGGSTAARAKHHEAGKLLVRERVDALLDPGSPFIELSALAAQGVYDDDLPGAGLVTGIGRVSGRACMIVGNDPTVKGGTYYPLTVKKHLRAQEIAGENALRCSRTATTSGVFSSIKPAYPRKASRRSPSCTVPARREAPMYPPCRITPSSYATRAGFFWVDLLW